MRTAVRRTLAVVLTGALLALPVGAQAGDRMLEDPDDTLGKLDLASGSHAHDGRRLEHRLVMQEAFAARLLASGTVTLFLKAGGRHRTLDLGFREDELFAEICTDETSTGGSFSSCSGKVTLTRPDRSALVVTVPRRLVQRGLTRYKWRAVTLLNQGEGGCTELICLDQLPDDGSWVRHRL